MLPVLIGIGVVALGGFLAGCGGEGAHLNTPPDAAPDTSPDTSSPPPPPVNTPPQISVGESFTAYQGFPINIPIRASDREGGDVRVTVEGLASTRSSFRIVEQRAGSTSANLRWGSLCTTPVGHYTARIRATDEESASSEREVGIDLRPATEITGQYEVDQSLSLCNGIYHGLNFLVTGFNLTLDGNGSTLSVASSAVGYAAVRVIPMRYDVTVQNFNMNRAGVVVSSARNVTLRNLMVNDAGIDGVYISGAEYVNIEDSVINSNSRANALAIWGSRNININRVTLIGSGADSSRMHATDNFRFGLMTLVDVTATSVEGCTVRGGDDLGGIFVASTHNTTTSVSINRSTIQRNWDGGIVVRFAGASARVTNSAISDNFNCGIRAMEGGTYTESGNTITGHTQSYCSR